MTGRLETFLFASLALTLTSLALVDSKSTKFTDCGSEDAKVSNVDITPCSTSPCDVVPGKTSSIDVTFTENVEADNLTAKAYGSIAGVKIPYPLPNPHACKNSSLTCPLKAGKKYDYTFSLTLPSELPQVAVIVELKMIAGDKKTVMCINFPVVVKPSYSKLLQMRPPV